MVAMSDERSIQRQDAYARLRPMLLHGQIAAGLRLGEMEWAAKLGVHRSALREAFGLLAHEGLLVAGERGGHFVPRFEKADLDEILELRAALEVAAMRRLSRSRCSINIDSLHAISQAMREMMKLKMPLGFAEADRRFHEQIITLAGNQRLTHAYLHAPTFIGVRLDLMPDVMQELMKITLGEHEAICEHLEAGQFDTAAELLEQHLFNAHSVGSASLMHMND